MFGKKQTRRDAGVAYILAALCGTLIASATSAAGAGVCTPPDAPLPEANPPGGPIQVCSDNPFNYCTDSAGCSSGECIAPTRVGNRYLRFHVPASWAGRQIALRVTLLKLDGYLSFNGETRWVGSPQSFPAHAVRYGPDPTFLAGHLECAPVYREWATTDFLNVYGSEVVPGSLYAVQAIEAGCDEAQEANYSDPLLLRTAIWGDTAAPYDNDGILPLGFNDFYPFFPLFEGYATSLFKPFVQLAPNEPDPSRPLSALDLEAVNHAFLGSPFPQTNSGPESCPHRAAACGDGVLDPNELCDDGNLTPGDGCDGDCRVENPTLIVRVVPVDPPAETGLTYSPDVAIDGNRVYLSSGGHRLWFELQLEGWAGDVESYQLDLAEPLTNDSGAHLAYPYPACASNAECEAVLGAGSQCWTYSDYDYCRWGFVNTEDPRRPYVTLHAEAEHRLTFVGAPIGLGSISTTDPRYVGTLVIDVPADAAGTYPIRFDRDVRSTFLRERVSASAILSVPIAAYEDAYVHVNPGCCNGTTCFGLNPNSCLASGWTPVPTCGGDCDGSGGDDACEVVYGMVDDCNGNFVPDECEPDCNANGTPDDCDVSNQTSADCNGNSAPDECDIADGTSLDCNGNGSPDTCDLALGLSDDCNFDGIPDDCQPNTDCNNNLVSDICDIGAGTSSDCNFDLVPDECQPQDDCNNNSIQDICDIADGTELDCNANSVPDSCDIAGGTSLDDNGDGVPDECCQPPIPSFVGPLKSRYLSLEAIGTPGVRSAIRVTFGANDSYPALAGQSLWVGPPRDYPEEDSSQPGVTFVGARLSCTPHYHVWSTVGLLHVFGAEIVPRSSYEVQLINEGCPDSFATNYSVPLAGETGKWGDVAPLYESPGNPPQPDFGDIAACVQKFLGAPGAPIKPLSQLQPNVVLPDRPVDFRDIAAVVTAFLGYPYVDSINSPGPCTCPSSVTCNATPCADDLTCAPGFCIDGYCMDKCGRCTP